MFILLIAIVFASTLLAVAFVSKKVKSDVKRIPGPTGYPLVGNGLEFIFPDSVGRFLVKNL